MRERKQGPKVLESEGDLLFLESTQRPAGINTIKASCPSVTRLGRHERCGAGKGVSCCSRKAGLHRARAAGSRSRARAELCKSLPFPWLSLGAVPLRWRSRTTPCQGPASASCHCNPRWTPSITWEQLPGTAAGIQELKSWNPAPFFLGVIFTRGDCLHSCCQAGGHRAAATG